MDLWQRLTGGSHDDRLPDAPSSVERDPDLDDLHRRQHDLINKATAIGLRDEWNRRLRRSWEEQ